MNKKKLLIGAAAAAAVGCAATAAKKAERAESKPKPTMWDKMRQHMEEMPADFPPRIMFEDVEATKANTEEILTLLRNQAAAKADDVEVIAST